MRTLFSIAKPPHVVSVIPKKGASVPIVQVHMLAGRGNDAKEALARELTAAVEKALGSAPAKIQVLVTEYDEGDWTVGGEALTPPCGNGS